MDFNHTEDRRMFAGTVAKYVTDNYDYIKRTEIAASDAGFDAKVWADFAELGLIGALFDEAAGGFGGAGFDIAVIFEELGKAIVVEPFLPTLVAGTLLAGDKDGRFHNRLEEAIGGAHQLAFCLQEPQSGYDPHDISTTLSADNLLNGHKAVVYNAGDADTLVVSALHGDDVVLLAIDKGRDGVTVHSCKSVDGYALGDIWFKDVKVSDEDRINPASTATGLIDTAIAKGTLAVCAEALGVMQSAIAITHEYLKTRTQFGVPIGKFQVLQHRLAEMMIELEQVRSAVINAAGHMDGDKAARDWYLSAAKNIVGRTGRLVSEESIQMHGGIGMTWEYSIAHFAKRLVMIDHLFGDEDYHLAKVVASSFSP